jgi:uncharacterized membrane protein
MIIIITIFIIVVLITIVLFEGRIRAKANKKLEQRIETIDLIMDEMETELKE